MAQNTPAQQLFDLLVTRGFDPKLTPAQSSENSEIISFKFISSSGKNYGTVVVMLGDDKNLELFSGDNLGRTMDSKDKTEWYSFQQQLKNFATRNFMTYKGQDISKLKYSMRGQAALSEGLYESWNGTKHVSWNGDPESVRLMIRHKRPMSIDEARYRQIESLFVETAEGERYKLPFRNLAGGRAMVEHVRRGGRPYDLRGAHIANMVEELNVLSRFRRASHGRVFEDDTADLVSQATAYHSGVSRALKGLGSARGYNTYFENWNPGEITEQELIIEDIKTLFVEQTIDSRIEQALPILARLQQQGTAMKEASIFEAWANRLVEGTWATPDTPEEQQQLVALLSQEFPVGADATNATEQLYSLVGDDQLFDQLHDLADQDAAADCRSLVLARIKELSDNGIDGFDTVLSALKGAQISASAPVAPVAPVAEEDEEYSVDGGMNNELLQDGMLGAVLGGAAGAALTKSPGGAMTGAELGSDAQDAFGEDEQDTIARLQELAGMNHSESDMEEGWKGALAGGLAGAGLGSVVPGLGTLAGGIAGAYAGHKIGDQGISDPSPAPAKPGAAEPQRTPPIKITAADRLAMPSGPRKASFQKTVDEGEEDTISRLRELSGMPHSETDMTETYRVPDTEDRSRFIRHNIWTVMDSDEEVMQYPVEGNPFFSAKKLMRKLDDEGYDFTHVISPEGRITYSPQHDPRHLKNFPDDQVDEGQEDSPVASAITRRILLQRSDLLSKYGPVKVMAAIDDVADFVGDTDEIGSSDVSGWIKQVEQSLAGMAEEVAVTTGNPPLEETTALQGQYGHSGKLQKFDEVEQDIVARLRELSGMIRPA